jgi:uncharacterized protein (TIGR00730 family)
VISVFCGSALGARTVYGDAARALGTAMGKRKIGLVYGGASVGLMGVLADAALEAGGEVVGVIPRSMVDRELAHPRLTRLEIVQTMHERKARMAELTSASIALPGGYGTLDETFEMLTWAQLGISPRQIVLLDVDGFYAPLVRHVEHATAEGFVRATHRGLMDVASTVEGALEIALRAPPTSPSKW